MRKLIAILLCAMLVVSSLAGCGKKEETPAPSAPAQTPAETKPAETKPAETAPQPAAKEPKYKEDIIIGIAGKITSLDPYEMSTTQHCLVFRAVYDTPLQFNNETSEIEPRLCTEWKTEDGKVYDFTLRDDVFFHNGEKLTADDFVYTYERGKETTLCKSMEKVEAVDPTHVRITLTSVNVDFPYMLTLPTSVILCKKALESGAEDAVSVGSGAFMLDSYEFGNYVLLRRNDNYWGEVARTKTLKYRYMPENSSRLIALETGEIDVCQDPDTNELGHITDNKDLELQEYQSCAINYLAFNNEKGTLANQNLRLALCYGIDRDELIDVVFNGLAKKSLSTWGWNEYGYNGGNVTNYEYNPDLAKEYLAKEGYGPDNPVTVDFAIIPGVRKAMGELSQSQLKSIGVNVSLTEYDSAGLTSMTAAGDHEAAFMSCSPNIFGDDMTRFIDSNTGANRLHLHDPKIHELMDKARGELDDAARKQMYYDVQQRLFDLGAMLPICTPNGYFGVRKGVGGIDYYPTTHHDFSKIYYELPQ